MTIAIIPIEIKSCGECPHSVTWDKKGNKWFCSALKGKTFKDANIIQDFCPFIKEKIKK